MLQYLQYKAATAVVPKSITMRQMQNHDWHDLLGNSSWRIQTVPFPPAVSQYAKAAGFESFLPNAGAPIYIGDLVTSEGHRWFVIAWCGDIAIDARTVSPATFGRPRFVDHLEVDLPMHALAVECSDIGVIGRKQSDAIVVLGPLSVDGERIVHAAEGNAPKSNSFVFEVQVAVQKFKIRGRIHEYGFVDFEMVPEIEDGNDNVKSDGNRAQ